METKQPKKRGRPALPDDQKMITYNVRMMKSQRAKLDSLGGAEWVRERIDSAKIKT